MARSGGRHGSRRRRCGASQDGRGRGVHRGGHRIQRLRVGGEEKTWVAVGGQYDCSVRWRSPAIARFRACRHGYGRHPERRRPGGRHYRRLEDAVAARRSRGYGRVGAPRRSPDRCGRLWPVGPSIGLPSTGCSGAPCEPEGLERYGALLLDRSAGTATGRPSRSTDRPRRIPNVPAGCSTSSPAAYGALHPCRSQAVVPPLGADRSGSGRTPIVLAGGPSGDSRILCETDCDQRTVRP